MKRKRNFKNGIIAMVLLISMFVPNFGTQEFYAASSYTNAMMFYESVTTTKTTAMETVDGTVYYATKAKLASSTTNLRYHTIGFDITLTGNGVSVSFSVARTGGSMVEVSNVQYGGYDYILYAVQDQTLFNLAMAANPAFAPQVLDASYIRVDMNAIMTTKQGGSLAGVVSENGVGGLNEWGKVYHLNNYSHLSTMLGIFSGHTFASYINIYDILENYKLYVNYNVQGTPEANANCTSTAKVGNGYTVSNGYLSQNGSQYIQSSRVLNAMTLVNPSNIALTKKGYHLDIGREWTALNQSFTHLQSYMPKSIYSGVGYGDYGITMYADWKPNTYTVNYHANSGKGTVASTSFIYDQYNNLQEAAFSKKGYKLVEDKEWNTKPDGSGKSYRSGESVRNITAENGGVVDLYAQWEPCVYEIREDKLEGTGGTDIFYVKYSKAFYLEESCESGKEITHIESPYLKGHTFMGYFRSTVAYELGENPLIKPDGVNASGKNHAKIMFSNTKYDTNVTIYAEYVPNKYKITFDKQGGMGGTDSIEVEYGQECQAIVEPYWRKDGFTFKGYNTKADGSGEMWYNEYGTSDKTYDIEGDTVLYAQWEDVTAPLAYIDVTTESWTNDPITITGSGEDYGVGLNKIELYDNTNLVMSNLAPNTTKDTISYVNPLEGVTNYRFMAWDNNAQWASANRTVKYDITPPFRVDVLNQDANLHDVTTIDFEKKTLSITLDLTDVKPSTE